MILTRSVGKYTLAPARRRIALFAGNSCKLAAKSDSNAHEGSALQEVGFFLLTLHVGAYGASQE